MVDNVALSPTGSASWPVVEGDEVVTEASALLNTADNNVLVFDKNTHFKLIGTALKRTYVYVRQGGLSFDAKSGPVMVCMRGRLFVPDTQAKGTLRLGANGAIEQRLTRGVFREAGSRRCDELGIIAALALPGAAGAIIPAAGGVATIGSSAAAIGAAAAATTAVGVGAATTAGFASSASSSACADTGCNANPATISPIQP
jgi:hypothetical protein